MNSAVPRPSRGAHPAWLRWLLGLGLALSVAATVLVVLSEQARWLRMAALLALWAALLAALAAARAGREARLAEMRQEQSKRIYELELLREVTARREYEIGMAEAAREQSDTAHREELARVRDQLERLTSALSGLLDGDVLIERLTLSAESTRVRALGADRARPGPAGRTTVLEEAPAEPVPPAWFSQQPGRSHDDDTVQFVPAALPEAVPTAAAVEVENPVAVESAEPGMDRAVESGLPEPAAVVPVPVVEPVADAASGAGPVAPADEAESVPAPEHDTAHSAGISVAELLAAYGATEQPHHRRRRAAD